MRKKKKKLLKKQKKIDQEKIRFYKKIPNDNVQIVEKLEFKIYSIFILFKFSFSL